MRQGQQNNKQRLRPRNNNNNGGSNNNNGNRKGPNPLTRSYESNGPDVKIRGTALHIAEKYVTLARDAQSSGDRVAAESYFQHAEHYYRIIAAAQAQMPSPQPIYRPDDDIDEDGEERGFGQQPGIYSSSERAYPQERGSQQSGYQGGERPPQAERAYQGESAPGDRGGYQGDRPQQDRGYQGERRPYQGERYQGDRQRGDRQHGDRGQPSGDRSFSAERNSPERPAQDRPAQDRGSPPDRSYPPRAVEQPAFDLAEAQPFVNGNGHDGEQPTGERTPLPVDAQPAGPPGYGSLPFEADDREATEGAPGDAPAFRQRRRRPNRNRPRPEEGRPAGVIEPAVEE